ncbi:uncharacterized protein MYCFIDRAFT_205895, partial [Pseudocercospora fijiensis CIRAD86]
MTDTLLRLLGRMQLHLFRLGCTKAGPNVHCKLQRVWLFALRNWPREAEGAAYCVQPSSNDMRSVRHMDLGISVVANCEVNCALLTQRPACEAEIEGATIPDEPTHCRIPSTSTAKHNIWKNEYATGHLRRNTIASVLQHVFGRPQEVAALQPRWANQRARTCSPSAYVHVSWRRQPHLNNANFTGLDMIRSLTFNMLHCLFMAIFALVSFLSWFPQPADPTTLSLSVYEYLGRESDIKPLASPKGKSANQSIQLEGHARQKTSDSNYAWQDECDTSSAGLTATDQLNTTISMASFGSNSTNGFGGDSYNNFQNYPSPHNAYDFGHTQQAQFGPRASAPDTLELSKYHDLIQDVGQIPPERLIKPLQNQPWNGQPQVQRFVPSAWPGQMAPMARTTMTETAPNHDQGTLRSHSYKDSETVDSGYHSQIATAGNRFSDSCSFNKKELEENYLPGADFRLDLDQNEERHPAPPQSVVSDQVPGSRALRRSHTSICPECGRKAKNASDARKHSFTHERPHKCREHGCG